MKFLAVFVTFPQSIISLFRTVQCSNLHKMMFFLLASEGAMENNMSLFNRKEYICMSRMQGLDFSVVFTTAYIFYATTSCPSCVFFVTGLELSRT